MGTYDTLNDVLVNLFRDINSIEENAITSQEYKDLTNNDMHVINAIGVGTTKNMSSIAKELSVTVGTLTISMNSLVKKGYVTRCRSTQDRRVVHISLSEKGVKAYYHHKHFHETDKTFRCGRIRRALLIPTGSTQNNGNQQHTVD